MCRAREPLRQAHILGRVRRIVAITGSIVFLDALLFGAIIPLLPGFADDYDLTKLEAGLVLGAYGGGALVGGIPGGLLVGRIGPKRGVVAGLAVLAAASVAFALAGDPVALGIARFVQGLSSATTWAGALAWVAVSVDSARRGQALGMVFGLAVFGFVVGPMFGGVADIVGIRPAFAAIALVAAALAAILLAVQAPPREERQPSAVRRAIRDRAFVGGLWLNTLPALFFGTLDVLVPLRLDDAGYEALAIAAVFLVAGLVEVAVNPVIGRVSDRKGRLFPVRAGLAASIAVSVAIAFAVEPARRRRARRRGLDHVRRLLHARDGARRRPRGARGAAAGHRLRPDEHRVGARCSDRPGGGRSARRGVRRRRPVPRVWGALRAHPRRGRQRHRTAAAGVIRPRRGTARAPRRRRAAAAGSRGR